MNIQENKSSFFILELAIDNNENTNFYREQLENNVDLILSAMQVSDICYKFDNKNKSNILYFFKSNKRKRKGELARYCQRYLPEEQQYKVEGIRSQDFEEQVNRIKKNNNFFMKSEPEIIQKNNDYKGSDLIRFENPKDWYPWQNQIYNSIFEKVEQVDRFKKPDPRHILSLVDKKGNTGKSSFFKWLYYKYPKNIGRIGYGSASQLRSSVVNIGKKELYIIDLSRSKSKNDRQEDLLSVLEDLKSGLVTNAMYGSGRTLLMEPPHIIVSSNYNLDYNLLSEDRWEVYEISNKKLVKININENNNSTVKKV
jgi:hypothetical protein